MDSTLDLLLIYRNVWIQTGQMLWYVLRSQSLRGRARLEFYKDEKSETNPRLLKGFISLIEITNAYVQDGESHKLHIQCADTCHVFGCGSMAEARDWLDALMKVSPRHIVSSPGRTMKDQCLTLGSTSNSSEDRKGLHVLVVSHSTLDCNSWFAAKFNVTVEPQLKLNFNGRCELVADKWDIYLKDCTTNQLIVSWPLQSIRKYAHGTCHFTIETGRYSYLPRK